MRKTFVIVIGSILLCGAVIAAMVPADPQPTTVTVNITGQGLEGVDLPWFDLSRSKSETVKWHNASGKSCTLVFSGGRPFPRRVTIPANGDSAAFSAADAPGPPQGWPENVVYKVYHYSVDIEGGNLFDSPGGGVRP